MAVRFQNLYNILRHWVNEKTQEKSCQCVEQVREAGRKPVALGNDSEKNLSCLSQQLSKIKSKTKLVSKLTLM